MSTNLATLIEPLKREVAVPGEFDTYFPNTGDGDLLGLLGDAFGECQLDGFFSTSTVATNAVTPDLSAAGGALVVLYAGTRMLRSKIRNTQAEVKYAAGGADYEVKFSANVLTQELKAMEDRKKQLLLLAQRALRSAVGTTFMVDAYLPRALGYGYFGGADLAGFYEWELGSLVGV